MNKFGLHTSRTFTFPQLLPASFLANILKTTTSWSRMKTYRSNQLIQINLKNVYIKWFHAYEHNEHSSATISQCQNEHHTDTFKMHYDTIQDEPCLTVHMCVCVSDIHSLCCRHQLRHYQPPSISPHIHDSTPVHQLTIQHIFTSLLLTILVNVKRP